MPRFTILIKLQREALGCLGMLMQMKVLHILLLYQFSITQEERVVNPCIWQFYHFLLLEGALKMGVSFSFTVGVCCTRALH